jgi:hypothetical protein
MTIGKLPIGGGSSIGVPPIKYSYRAAMRR